VPTTMPGVGTGSQCETPQVPAAASNQPHQIVTGILIRGGRVLLCRRSASKERYPSVWDFPGGHIDGGESPGASLVRELREELGVAIPEPKDECLARLRTNDAEMRIWLITEWTGTPHNAAPEEHDEIAWFEQREVVSLELAQENYPAIIADALARAES
jgi:8-oxo-dGTP diphosphatase